MSLAAALAFTAAALGVLAGWEVLGLVERARLARWLEQAVVPAVRPGREPTLPERRRLTVLVAVSLLAGGWIVAGPLLGLVAALAAPAALMAFLRARRRRYVTLVRRGAAPAARAIAAGLSAGRSVRGALAEAASAVDGPAAHELALLARALDVGEPTETALERLRSRAGGGPWDTLVAAVLLQRDAGGDLAALLRRLAASLDAGVRAERDARAATAQSRFTAGLVVALPLAAAAIAELASPGFVGGLVSDPLPAALTAAAAVLQAIAMLLVRRLARPRLDAP